MSEPFSSPQAYSEFIYALPERYSSIDRSTLVYIPTGARFGRVVGIIIFTSGVILCIHEYLNFELGVIEGYGYEVSRPNADFRLAEMPLSSDYCKATYPHKEKLYLYDSMPHPLDSSLAATDPHHKHVPPDIKHNRIPTPDLSFSRPNLPFLIEEAEKLFLCHH